MWAAGNERTLLAAGEERQRTFNLRVSMGLTLICKKRVRDAACSIDEYVAN
jgi:hypothetical protein